MTPNKEDIKYWMAKNGITREKLAEQCFVEKSSVDNWFRSRGVIPEAKLALIEILIAKSNKGYPSLLTEINPKEEAREELKPVVVVFSREEMKLIEDASAMIGMTPPQFIESVACQDALMSNQTGHCIITHRSVVADAIKEGNVKPRRRQTHSEQILSSEREERKMQNVYEEQVIGNIAAGSLEAGDTIPYTIKTHQRLSNGEYILRVNGNSMEPQIMDGTLVIMRKHTVPPIPKIGTIVEYHDERGVTIKKLAQRKTPEGKKEYILHSINPSYPDIHPMDGGKISAVYVRTLSIEA
ncbi:MAG: S24 family peptidase [Akkermansia sp.]